MINKHIISIALNGIRSYLSPITLFLVSYFIVNSYSKELWGEFVVYLLTVNLIAHITNWGSRDFLLRRFSQDPSNIYKDFYSNLATRNLYILLPISLLFFISSYSELENFLLIIWALGLFFYQSSESLIVYSKKFSFQVIVEVVSLLLLLIIITLLKPLNTLSIMTAFIIVTWLKTIILCVKYYPKQISWKIDRKQVFHALPFFLIGLSGLLQSRIDQYIIASNCDKSTIASYQLFFSIFILIQSLSVIVITPFNKVLYRIRYVTFNKIHRLSIIFGLLIILLLTPLAIVILSQLFQIQLDIWYYLYGALFVLPSFVYVPIIYLFYRHKKEKEIMIVNYIGAAMNLALTFLFIYIKAPFYAIAGSAFSQWLMLVWYVYRKKTVFYEVTLSDL